MKKLKFKGELLSHDQMRNVKGGNGCYSVGCGYINYDYCWYSTSENYGTLCQRVLPNCPSQDCQIQSVNCYAGDNNGNEITSCQMN